MLFIDDDQPEFGKRQEQCRAGADDDPRPAIADRTPGVAALALTDLRVPLCRQNPKALPEPLQPLRAKRDFRQQHQGLLTGGEGRGDRREIGLGLAGAGDAVEHGDRKTAVLDTGDEPARGGGLVIGKRDTLGPPIRRREWRAAPPGQGVPPPARG